MTDSHPLLWAGMGRARKLGRSARRMFDLVDRGRAAIYVPTVVFVELGEAARGGRTRFADGFESWMLNLLSSGRYFATDLTAEVVLAAEDLYEIPERTDRLIAATAVVLGLPLLTADPDIAAVAGVERLWD